MTINDACKKAKKILTSSDSLCDKSCIDLDVKILIKKFANIKNDVEFVLNADRELKQNEEQNFFKAVQKRKSGISTACICQSKFFYQNEFIVNKNTLIPRPESEIIVEICSDYILSSDKTTFSILDICTGSGCIGLSICLNCRDKKHINLTLSDISKKALDVCKKNNNKFNCNAKIVSSNLFQNIDGKFDIITANPPYLSKKEYDTVSAEVKEEPFLALVSKDEGYCHIKEILTNIKNHLEPHFFFMMEIGYMQGETTLKIAKENFSDCDCNIVKDLSGLDRFIVINK